MKLARVTVAVVGVSLAACGDDGGQTKLPDASMQPPPDARVCGTLTGGAADFLGHDPDNGSILWFAPITGTLTDGYQMYYQLEFYQGIESTLSGTFDLAQGAQANYQTCAVCIRAFAIQGQNVVKRYFQTGGSITLSEDPFTNKHLIASISGLTFEEVTIDSNTYVSTPVAGGLCGAVADTSLDRDSVPTEWTCTPRTDYGNGVTCDCMCGTADPDCATDTLPVAGCTNSNDACLDAACVARPANDTCATAVALTSGEAMTGTTVAAKRDYSDGLQDATACTGRLQPGRDVVYSLTLGAGDSVTATLSGLAATYNGSIALVGPGDATICDAAPITTCVQGGDLNSTGTDETLTFTATDPGNYFIIVDSPTADSAGTFTLTATVTPP